MTVKVGLMELLATEPADVIENYVNGLQPDGGEWTNWTRLSGHDHSGGLLGKPVAVNIPAGSITTDKLDPSVLAPYALTDGSKPFTGQVTMQADAVVRDRLSFGEQGTALAPDNFWERAAPNRLRTDSNLGVGVAPAAWGSTMSALQVGGLASVFADKPATGAEAQFFGHNTYFDGAGFKAIGAGGGSFLQQQQGVVSIATAPSVAAGAAQTFTTRLTVDQAGNVGVGVAPAAWTASGRVLQLGTQTALWDNTSGASILSANTYSDGTNNRALTAGFGSRALLHSGGLYVETAPSVAAGAVQTFTTRLQVALNGTTTIAADAGQNALTITGTAAGGGIDFSGGVQLIRNGGGNLLFHAGAPGVVGPALDNTVTAGGPSNRYNTVFAVAGTINTSLAEAKEAITPLDPAAALEAVRATTPVTFDYKAPTRGPEWYELPDDPEQAEAVLLQRMRAAPLEEGARHQAGVVLGDPTHPCDPLFSTGEGQTNPSNTAGILLAALKAIDARVTALEPPVGATRDSG